MVKTKLIIACFFALLIGGLFFWIYIQNQKIDSLERAKNTLEANNNLLLNRLEREHNDKLEVSRKNEELKAKINNDKSGFDWHYNLNSNPVLLEFKRLHQN